MSGKTTQPNQNFYLGLRAFNKKRFYEAHEYFESAWRQTQDDSREFYRALLDLSGGFYRLEQARPVAAGKFFNRGLYWLEKFPKKFMQLNNDAIMSRVKTIIDAINEETDVDQIIQRFHFHFETIDNERSL